MKQWIQRGGGLYLFIGACFAFTALTAPIVFKVLLIMCAASLVCGAAVWSSTQ